MEARPLGWKPSTGALPEGRAPMMNDSGLSQRIAEINRREREEMEQLNADMSIGKLLKEARAEMKEARGTERSERSRRIAICITELEKVIAYWDMWVEDEEP